LKHWASIYIGGSLIERVRLFLTDYCVIIKRILDHLKFRAIDVNADTFSRLNSFLDGLDKNFPSETQLRAFKEQMKVHGLTDDDMIMLGLDSDSTSQFYLRCSIQAHSEDYEGI